MDLGLPPFFRVMLDEVGTYLIHCRGHKIEVLPLQSILVGPLLQKPSDSG